MWDVLSALIPPAVVATVFCTFVYKLLRKEMAPRTSDGRLVDDTAAASTRDAEAAEEGKATTDEGTKPGRTPATEVSPRDDDTENH